MKKFVKALAWSALAVVLALAGLSAFFFVAGRDIDPPDVDDVLPPPRQPIVDAENMVPILLDATNRLALTRFRRKCGRNPQSLSELVPEFMTEVPRDPFDADMPLGYNFEQGTLHTVGANGTFNGKVRDPRQRFGGLRNPDYRYIRRIDGRSMEPPLKERE